MTIFIKLKCVSSITIPIPDKVVTDSRLMAPVRLQEAVKQYEDVETRSSHCLYLRQYLIARLRLAAELDAPIAVFRTYFGALSGDANITTQQQENQKVFNYEFVRYGFAVALREWLAQPTFFDYIGLGLRKLWGLLKPKL